MTTPLLMLLFFLGGAAAGYFFTRRFFRPTDSSYELETQRRVAEAKAFSQGEQIQKLESELSKLETLLRSEAEAKTIAVTRLEESFKNLEEQKRILELSREQLTGTFQALSDAALKSNNEAFLQISKNSFESVMKSAKGELSERTLEIKGVVGPLEKALEQCQRHIESLEKSRAEAYGSLSQQLESLASAHHELQRETGNLAAAFRNPNVRGQWGQLSLRRIVELAGMTEHCDFSEQVSVAHSEGRLQPDMVINLPGGSQVVIDSKVVLQAYREEYLTAADETARKAALSKHAQQMRKHMLDLSSKSYWSQFSKAPEFVIMFVPGEPFVSAACDQDPGLIEEGMSHRVVLATPNTLMTLLRTVAMGWRQEQVARNTQQIADLGKQVYDRFSAFLGHLAKTRGSLEQSIFNFNRTVASLEGRVLPSLRKFKDLGATGADELPSVEPIEQSPRQIEALEIKESESSEIV